VQARVAPKLREKEAKGSTCFDVGPTQIKKNGPTGDLLCGVHTSFPTWTSLTSYALLWSLLRDLSMTKPTSLGLDSCIRLQYKINLIKKSEKNTPAYSGFLFFLSFYFFFFLCKIFLLFEGRKGTL
jgi:hypothetical protein